MENMYRNLAQRAKVSITAMRGGNARKHLARCLAVLVTSAAVAMSVASACDHGSDAVDKGIMAVIYSSIIIGSHVGLTLWKGKLAQAIWFSCTLVAVTNQVSFLNYAEQRAAVEHAQKDMRALNLEREIQSTKELLNRLTSRPVSTIRKELKASENSEQRDTLRAELMEAQRATRLHSRLVDLTDKASEAHGAAATNLLAARVAEASGWKTESVTFFFTFLQAVVFELLGALLWRTAVLQDKTSVDKSQAGLSDEDRIRSVRTAIADGQIRPITDEIRTFLRCGQIKAAQIRQAVVGKGR